MKTLNTNAVVTHITEFLKEYADNAGIKTLVVGISGGIDSSVVSALCVRTGLDVIMVDMPIGTNGNTLGKQHYDSLGELDNIHYYKVDLTESFETQRETLVRAGLSESKLQVANMASRLRMLTLYAFSNRHSGLVVGTGNKVEDFGVGFFTRGGDGTVDISPIADLMKSEVYALGSELGVIDEILQAKPTDGLWDDGRTDEDQIGASYDELEWAMRVEEGGYNPMYLTSREMEVMKIYKKWNHRNKFKMVEVPICRVTDEIKYQNKL